MLIRYKRSCGFTLIEIVVVLAILLLLMSIITPVFHSAREKANQAACMAQLHQIALGVRQYHVDAGRFPANLEDISPYIGLRISDGKVTTGKKLIICPDDDTIRDTAYTNSNLPYSSYYDTSATDIVWNYWGYKPTGFAYAGDSPDFYASMMDAGVTNPNHYTRLANRFAPDNTIITHCIYHRNKTGKNENQQIDVVVRVSGSAHVVFQRTYDWLAQPD